MKKSLCWIFIAIFFFLLGSSLDFVFRPGKHLSGQKIKTETKGAAELKEGKTQQNETKYSESLEQVQAQIDAIFIALSQSNDGQESQALLSKLKNILTSIPKPVAVRAIREFLDTKRDTGTKLAFRVGKNGSLAGTPTLRVFLLDCLGLIDSASAKEYAISILGLSTSADEWAVCIRNVAWGDPSGGVSYIQSKFKELLANESWRKNPSIGYLEAFDAAVYANSTEATPTLCRLLDEQSNSGLPHAAYLTLDRLVIAGGTGVLGQLLAEPDLMKGHELTRAGFFARADVTDSSMRTLVENYLLDQGISKEELDKFAALFPNANFMVSNNLLTNDQTPSYGEIAKRDAVSLDMVNTWLTDPRFEKVYPQLQTIQKRLTLFVNQAKNSPSR